MNFAESLEFSIRRQTSCLVLSSFQKNREWITRYLQTQARSLYFFRGNQETQENAIRGRVVRNPLLEQIALIVLARRHEPIHFWAFSNNVSLEMDDPDLTTDEFRDTLRHLEDRGLVQRKEDSLGYTVWSITQLGKTASNPRAFERPNKKQ